MATINVPGDKSTIQKAINSAVSGDTIDVDSGTFDENVRIKKNNLTLIGDGVGSTTIEGQVFVPSGSKRPAGSVSGLTMENFTVESGTGGGKSLDIETGGKNTAPQTDLTFSDNEFVAPDGGFAVIAGNVEDVTFNDNTFSVNSSDTAEKLVFVGGERSFKSKRSSDSVKFTNNTFTGDVSDINGGAVALEHEASNSTGGVNGEIDSNDFSGVNLADSNDLIAAAFGDGDSGPDKDTRVVITGSSGVDVKGESSVGNEIQPVVDFAVQNEEINIKDGTYDEQVVINRDNDASGLTLEADDSTSTPTIEQTGTGSGGGEPTVAVDQDGITLRNLKITRTATNDRAAQAVRVAGDTITLDGNDCEVEGSNNAAIGIFTESSGAAGTSLSSSKTIDSVTIKGGTITASTDTSADGEVGVLVADNGPASFSPGAVTIGSGTSVDFTVAEGNDHVLELDTGGDVINRQDVLTNNGNTFNTQNTSASAASPDGTDQNRSGFSVAELIASTVQDAVDAADSGANVDIKDGTYEERVVIDRVSDNSGLTLTSAGSSKPVIEKNDDNGKPTIAVDHDGITLSNLEVKRDSDKNVAQAVRIAGNKITLDSNNCKIEGSDNAAIAVLTDSSGAAGNPPFTGTIDSVTIDGGTITASTDDNANGEVGVAIADSGNAKFPADSNRPAVTIGSSSQVTFETDEGNDYLVEQGTGGGVVDLQSVLGNNEFNPNTNASGVSVSNSDRSEFGLSVDGLVASTIQDAVGDAAAGDAIVKVKGGNNITYNEEVTIGKNITLTKTTGTPTISGQVRITGAVGGSKTLEVSDLDINYDSGDAGSGKKSTVLFEKNQHVGVTLDDNTITAPSNGYAVYKNKSGGGTSSPDNNVTLSNNTFDTNGGPADQLVVIRSVVEGVSSPKLPNNNSVTIDNNDFNGTINRPSGLSDERGSALDHRARNGNIQNNEFGGVSAPSGTDIEPIASATGANTSIKENGDGGNSGLDFEGESAAGNDIQTELDKNDPGEAVEIIHASSNEEFKIDAQNGTNKNKIQIPDSLGANVTIKGSNKTNDPELQVPDDGTGIEVNESDTNIKDLSIKGPSNDTGTAIDVSNSDTTIKDVEIGSGSAPDTGVVVDGSGSSGASNCTITGNSITVNPTAAVEIKNGSSNNVIEDNSLKTAGNASGGAGVLIKDAGGGNLIALNDIDSAFNYGIDIEDPNSANASNVTVRFNNLRGDNAGIRNKDDENVDARSNFWNDKTGPSGGVDDPETGRTADGDGSSINNANNANNGQVRYDEFLEIPNGFILNTGRDTDGDTLHEDFNNDSDHFPTDGYLFLRALRQGHFDRLANIDGTGGKLSTDYSVRFDFDGDGADDITRDDVNEMVINRNR